MRPDAYGNMALYAVDEGVETRMATFTRGGSVSLGQLPPPRSLWGERGQLHLSGSPSSATRDGWQVLSEVNVTDPNGQIVGTMGSAQYLESPGVKGVQFYDRASDTTLTFADGVLFVGHVSRALYDKNKPQSTNSVDQGRVLVGGNVISETKQQTVKFACRRTQSTLGCNEGLYLRVQTITGTSSDTYHCYNGAEKDVDEVKTMYLKPGKYARATNAGLFADIMGLITPAPAPSSWTTFEMASDACTQQEGFVKFTLYSGEVDTTGEEYTASLDKVVGGKYLSCTCPHTEENANILTE